jgi:hypothetical protein
VASTATSCFPRVYLPFPYPWTRLFNTQRWFVSKDRISAETCLPVRFAETPTCHIIKNQFYVRVSQKTRLNGNMEACENYNLVAEVMSV